MQDIKKFRIDKHDEQIEAILNHNSSVNNSLIIVNEALRTITKNIEEIFIRLKVLEEDHTFRKLKRSFFKTLVSYWPLLAGLVIIISAVDISKIISFIKSVK